MYAAKLYLIFINVSFGPPFNVILVNYVNPIALCLNEKQEKKLKDIPKR